jgi:molybdopterin converting factor small subunit
MSIFAGGERASLDKPLSAGDEVFVLTVISGGRGGLYFVP